jgi:heme o synthase
MKNKAISIGSLLKLFKFKISFFVGLSVSFSFILEGAIPDLVMFAVSFGVFLLACGACGLNEIQEQKEDSIMERTKKRPLPNGDLTVKQGLIISVSSLIVGLSILLSGQEYYSLIIGISAVLWYNVVYTPLKRKTSLAIIPGAFVGVAGPMIGWLAAGGDLFDFRLLVLCLFFYIWQIPHFILLMVSNEKDYLKAGFPVITRILTKSSLNRIIHIWVFAMVISCLLIPYINGFGSRFTLLFIFLLGIILLWRMNRISFAKPAIIELNLYVLLVSILLSLDKLIF